MAGTEQIWVEQWRHLLRKKYFLVSPWDGEAKPLGYYGYEMKAMFQLRDNISSIISWHNYLDINKTRDWTLNSPIGIHREQTLQKVCEVVVRSYLSTLRLQFLLVTLDRFKRALAQAPSLSPFVFYGKMYKGDHVCILYKFKSHVTCGFLSFTGSSFQCVISTLLLGVNPWSRYADVLMCRYET